MNHIVLIIICLFLCLKFTSINKKEKKKNNKIIIKNILTKKEKINLKKGQLIMTDMLRLFNKICNENNLKYWCVGGTLIGAVRHKGWIPHDADVDVAMLERDYKVLQLIINKYLPNYYWFQDKITDMYYSSNIGKIRYLNAYYSDCKNKKSHNGLQLDIFVFKEKLEYLVPTINSFYFEKINRNMIFPLKELLFEDIKVYVPNKYCEYLINGFGGCPPPELPKEEQYPHEGRITFDVPKWIKDKYPKLYYK